MGHPAKAGYYTVGGCRLQSVIKTMIKVLVTSKEGFCFEHAWNNSKHLYKNKLGLVYTYHPNRTSSMDRTRSLTRSKSQQDLSISMTNSPALQ